MTPANWTHERGSFTDNPTDITPADITADGTTFYEWMGPAGTTSEYKVPFDLAAGQAEPIRNMSLLNGLKETVLDPRYAPTGGATHSAIVSTRMDDDDDYNPSIWFITYEVGDNTTVEFGEALPMDMYYSRATNYGDDFEYVYEGDEVDYDGDYYIEYDSDENEFYFDWLEGKKDDHAAEAAMSGSPGGKFFWTIWNQWKEDEHENVWDSDATMRRLMFTDDDNVDDGSGGGGKGGKGKFTAVVAPEY